MAALPWALHFHHPGSPCELWLHLHRCRRWVATQGLFARILTLPNIFRPHKLSEILAQASMKPITLFTFHTYNRESIWLSQDADLLRWRRLGSRKPLQWHSQITPSVFKSLLSGSPGSAVLFPSRNPWPRCDQKILLMLGAGRCLNKHIPAWNKIRCLKSKGIVIWDKQSQKGTETQKA